MILNYQQLPPTNPLMPLAQPATALPYKPSSGPTVAGVGRDQVVTSRVVRVPEPAVIQDLRALREEERNAETPITHRAFSDTKTLLEFARLVLGELPRTLLVPDGEGGIRIEWRRNDRSVRVIIPPRSGQTAYIYQRVGLTPNHSRIHQSFKHCAQLSSLPNLPRMPRTDSVLHPRVYRAITNKRWYDVIERKIDSAAFVLRPQDTGLFVLKSVGCSHQICRASQRQCYGEFMLETNRVRDLGLGVVDDEPGSPNFSENHAEITQIPINPTTFEERQLAEDLATDLAELSTLYYDRYDRYV
jgi:hypothetical protein